MLKESDLTRLAERLSADFEGQIPRDVAMEVLRRYVKSHATARREQVELAVRIQLQVRRQGNPHDLV